MFNLYCLLLHGMIMCLVSAFIAESSKSRCEEIIVPMCQDMPYNMTKMPNYMGHQDQRDAILEIHAFTPLVQIGCSRRLKFFLCSLYTPLCSEQIDVPIPSCQSVCEEVKSQCNPFLEKFRLKWPSILNCSRFPSPKNELCMKFPAAADDEIVENERHQHLYTAPKDIQHFNFKTKSIFPKFWEIYSKEILDVNYYKEGRCPNKYVEVFDYQGKNFCVAQCDTDILFTKGEKYFAQCWMAAWSCLCFATTFFTIITCLIDSTRFKYPEKPIIFMSGSYNAYSMSYIIRLIVGSSRISCDLTEKDSLLIFDGLNNSWCMIVFLLLYYFGMTSYVWWVILTVTWYLSANRKWSNEAIETISVYFHVGAWILPAVMTIAAFLFRHVDADELTGLCFTGNSNNNAQMGFVITPLALLLFLGIGFFLASQVSLVRIRTIMQRDGRDVRNLDRFMIRKGVFSFLYVIPMTCVLACNVYEYYSAMNVNPAGCKTLLQSCATTNRSRLVPEVTLLKIFMSLLVGTTCSMWLFSKKTWKTWHSVCTGRFCRVQLLRKTANLEPVYQIVSSYPVVTKNRKTGKPQRLTSLKEIKI